MEVAEFADSLTTLRCCIFFQILGISGTRPEHTALPQSERGTSCMVRSKIQGHVGHEQVILTLLTCSFVAMASATDASAVAEAQLIQA